MNQLLAMSVIINKDDSKEKIDKMIQEAAGQKRKSKINLDRFFGKVNFGVDGLEYQKGIRDEWEQDRSFRCDIRQ